MKVLIVTAMFPPNRTGTSFYAKNLATALCERGNDLKVVTTVNRKDTEDEKLSYTVIRISAWHFPIKNYFKHLRFCALIPQSYIKLFRIVKQFQPDAILLINHYLDIAFPAIYAAKKSNTPLYISVGTQLQSLNKIRNKILRILDRLIVGRLIFPFAKKIISWDKEIERYITDVHNKKNASKSVIIPFGVNGNIKVYDNFNNTYDKKNQLLGVGAIIDHRDYLYQIKVFSELIKRYPDLRLKIIGNQYIDKPERYAEKLGVRDKVIFTGEISHDEVLKEYQKSILHWMMLTGQYVGLGTSTLEAMLMGVPSVSNAPENLFGSGELKDMENYIYTDVKSVNKDVEKISTLIDNKAIRRKIGQNGKAFINEHLNWEKVANQFETMINIDIH